MVFDDLDKRIIAALQAELPLVPEPFRLIAQNLKMDQAELLSRLTAYRADGKLRKIAAVIRHRAAGYEANALCAWVVPPAQLDEAGRRLAGHFAVTHCYSRQPQTGWPYNLYIMIHAGRREECEALIAQLAGEIDNDHYTVMFSTREWKKSSPQYFPPPAADR